MRVISGKYRGRNLFAEKDESARPTLDRVKEAVFNKIQWDIEGCYFLDLFSGTGSVGIEAMSRGAAYTVFVDNRKEGIQVINKNIDQLKADKSSYLVIENDYKAALKSLSRYRFQIVYCDPPFDKKEIYGSLLDELYNVVKAGGLVIIESDFLIDKESADFELISSKKYGAIYITIYKKGEK